MGRFSEQERALVRAWRKANQAEREALEAAVRRILPPGTPQIQYEMRARGYSAQDMAQQTGVAPERVEKIRDAQLEPLRSFLRGNEYIIQFCLSEKIPVEGELIRQALIEGNQTAVKDIFDLIKICTVLKTPIENAVRDFISREIDQQPDAGGAA